jgi:hypothetical protein
MREAHTYRLMSLLLRRTLSLALGRYVAWQTPLHREAVKKALM